VRTFNDTLKSSLASYTDKTVLYFDAEYLHDRMYYYATQSNGTWTYNAGACTVQLSSQKCTTDTLLPSTTTTTGYVDYSTYLFADSLYPTPVASHSFAYDTYATGVISFIRYYW
jgi:phospholipase/lecithinase/hemolysin